MANDQQVKIIKRGVELWNRWREDNPYIHPDLSDSDLRGIDLRGVNLSRADLRRIYMSRTNLQDADLSNADLRRAFLNLSILRAANLIGADLRGTNLFRVDLEAADLKAANIYDTDLRGAILNGANLSGATIGWTIFGQNDLSCVVGLDTVIHYAPSIVDIDTVYLSKGNIPEIFLRGAGVPDNFIVYMDSLTKKAFQFYSCFISYSSKNQQFAERIYADLQGKGVRCWFAPEDLKIGDKIRVGIDESIRKHDKLLLILSKHSVSSNWVEREVETAFEQERIQRKTVLFPIRLDNTVMKIDTGWPAEIRRSRNIGDFRKWKDHDTYQKALRKLLQDLKADD